MLLTFLCLTALFAMALIAFSKSYITGVCASVTILVAASEGIRINLPNDIPPLSIHRLVLVIWFVQYFIRGRPRTIGRSYPPAYSLLVLLLCSKLISAFLSTHPTHSLKDWIGILFEQLLFYNLAFRSIVGFDDAIRVTKAAVIGLGIAGMIAFYEYYSGVNIAAHIDPTIPNSIDEGILGTFRHRILLGYAMAMLIPLSLVIAQSYTTGMRRHFYRAVCLLGLAVCYFSNSRGPWLGAALGLAVLGYLAGKRVRKLLITLFVLSLAVLILRPGVRSTISSLILSTGNADSLRGGSFSYRNELWRVAFSEISKSPIRILFGYGGLSTEFMNLYDQFQFGGNVVRTGYSSWDNQYAGNLIEYGFVGFTLEFSAYIIIVTRLWKRLKKISTTDKDFRAALLASIVIYLWALSNVWMFAIQIKFLFWTITAASFLLANAPPVADPAKELVGDGAPQSSNPSVTRRVALI